MEGEVAKELRGIVQYTDLYELIKITERLTNVYDARLKEFIDGEISQDMFLDEVKKIDELLLENATFTSGSFEDFSEYCRTNFPEVAEEALAHERNHALIAEKYGLKVIYGCFNGGWFSQPFIVEEVGIIARDWEKQKLLSYLKESVACVSDPSHGDEAILNHFKEK